MVVLVDPFKNASARIDVPPELGAAPTLRDALQLLRDTDARCPDIERRRLADSLFTLEDDGSLGELIRGLGFRVDGRPRLIDQPLDECGSRGAVLLEIDRANTGYPRPWPAFVRRRWNLRSDAYERFIESVVESSCGRDADSVLRLDTSERIRRFLRAIARRIHDAPYETYSRYLEPSVPFRSCDQTLDSILEGDGGNCAEKAMALYFAARAHGIPVEIVLGGENASAKFPFRALRSILDERTFDNEATRDSQRYWQHYAVLCQTSDDAEDAVFCDVAGSNIPFLFLDLTEASAYLDPRRRMPLPVTITLESISVYYHRLEHRQDIPLDLAYAMEHSIAGIDVIHTVDNELGLLHAGDVWVGVVASRDRRELRRIVAAHERFVERAGRDPRADLCFTADLASPRHPLHEGFLRDHPRPASRILAAESRLRQRIQSTYPDRQIQYVILALRSEGSARES